MTTFEGPTNSVPGFKGEELNLGKFSPEQRQSLMEVRAYKDTWGGESEEIAAFAYDETQKWGTEFLKTHPDARSYALYQTLIGGANDDAFEQVDYPNNEILDAARAIEKKVRDRVTGLAEAA